MVREILFLGYGPARTRLVKLIESRGVKVHCSDQPITNLSPFDLTISFGYRHILTPSVLATSNRPSLNLHIAYLPFNRGAHPLFWAAMEGTPNGVTIHEIDEGIDTGPIVVQKEVDLDYSVETFSTAYNKLIREMENLFETHMEKLLRRTYYIRQPLDEGSFHRKKDLPSGFSWDSLIAPTIRRLKEAPCPA